jgi:hypothetical protein
MNSPLSLCYDDSKEISGSEVVNLSEAQNILNFIYDYNIKKYELIFMCEKYTIVVFYCDDIILLGQNKILDSYMTLYSNDHSYINSGCYKIIKNPYEPVDKGGLINSLKEKYNLLDKVQVKCNEYFTCNLKPVNDDRLI